MKGHRNQSKLENVANKKLKHHTSGKVTVNEWFLREHIIWLNILKRLLECISLSFVEELNVSCVHHLVSVHSLSLMSVYREKINGRLHRLSCTE